MSRSGAMRRALHLHGQGDRSDTRAHVPGQLRRRVAGHAAAGHGAQVPQGTGDGYRGHRSETSHGHRRRSHTPGNCEHYFYFFFGFSFKT